jgi:hypothetical protein
VRLPLVERLPAPLRQLEPPRILRIEHHRLLTAGNGSFEIAAGVRPLGCGDVVLNLLQPPPLQVFGIGAALRTRRNDAALRENRRFVRFQRRAERRLDPLMDPQDLLAH